MKNLIIIGARGFGREIHNLATQCTENTKEWVIKGFLDDKADALDSFKGYAPILGPVETYEIKDNDIFCCALGDVIQKMKYADIVLKKGGVFANLIHPSVVMNSNVSLGYGLIINVFTYISNDVKLGNFVCLMNHVAVGHDVTIGDWSQVNSFSFMGGFCKIGECVTLNPGSNILPGKSVGDYAKVGIGSTVLKDVKPHTTVFGNPAKSL